MNMKPFLLELSEQYPLEFMDSLTPKFQGWDDDRWMSEGTYIYTA